MQPQRTVFSAGGDRLEAALWPGADPPLVLLHEGLGSVDLSRAFPHELARATGRAVAAWSRAGYGRSAPCALPRPRDYMAREAALLPEILAALGAERVILVGHSDGASIAALADHAPEIAGLVLIAPHFFVDDCSVAAIVAACDAYATGDLRARLARHHTHVDAAFRCWCDAWLDPGFRDWNIQGCLDRVRCPVLAIQGSADPYGTDAQVEAVAARVPQATVRLIQGAGHAPHQETPAAVLPLIADFVASIA